MVDTDEIKRILQDILSALTLPGEGTASVLINEVRLSLRARSEPTVAEHISQLQRTMQDEFRQLKDVVRDTGGAGGGHGAGGGGAGSPEFRDLQDVLVEHLTRIDSAVERMERAIVTFSEEGHMGGGHGGDRTPHAYYEREIYLNAGRLADEIMRGTITTRESFGKMKDLFGSQVQAVFKDVITNLINFSLHSGNVASQLRNLHGILKQEVGAVVSQGVFGSNVAGPLEYMLEGPKRAMDGVLLQTDSLTSTLKTIHQSLQENLQSPLALTGRDINELSRDFHDARQTMREKMNFDSRGWMNTEETNKAVIDMVEVNRRMGIQSGIRDQRTLQSTAEELNYLKIIAAMTGKTVAQLEITTASAMREQARLTGLGRQTPEEARTAGQIETGLTARLGVDVTKKLTDFANELMGYGRTANEILGSDRTPEPIKRLFSTEPVMMKQIMDIMEDLRRTLESGETKQSRTEMIITKMQQLDIDTFNSLGRRSPEQEGRYGGASELLQSLMQAVNVARTGVEPGQALKDRSKENWDSVLLGTMQDWFNNQIKPIFGGLGGALGWNTAAIIANTLVLSKMAGGGLMGLLGTAAKGALRVGGGIAAAGGVAYEGYNAYQNFSSGNVGTAAAQVGGMAGGAAIGAIIGRLTGFIGGPMGSMIGAGIGGYLGSAISGYLSKPAVPAPGAGMQGPGTNALESFVAQNSGYQDSNLGMLEQLLQVNGTSNAILTQIYGGIQALAGAQRGDPNGAGGGVPAGRSGQVTPPAIGRADASYAGVG